MEIKSFNSNGLDISYGKSGEGQPLIFVHGNMGSGAFFKDCHKLFSGYTVFTPDSRSHGKSGKVKRLNYNDMADDIVRLIEHEKMEKPILFGFSDGGIIALLIAIKHPNLLGKIIPAGINLTPKGINGFWRFTTRLVFCFTFLLKFGDKMRLMLTQPNITAADLKNITTPTILLYGEKDIVKLADSQTVLNNAQNAKLVIIPKENHGSYIQNNTKLYDILKEYLKEEKENLENLKKTNVDIVFTRCSKLMELDNQNTNQKIDCPCPKVECGNHGKCEACSAKHELAGNLPNCKRGGSEAQNAAAATTAVPIIKTCTCPNLKCKRHGNCAACSKNHKGKRMYCTAKDGSFRKKLVDTIFRKNKKKMDAEKAEQTTNKEQQ